MTKEEKDAEVILEVKSKLAAWAEDNRWLTKATFAVTHDGRTLVIAIDSEPK